MRLLVDVVGSIPAITIRALPLTAAGKEDIETPLAFNWGRDRSPGSGTGLCGHSIEVNFTSAYERYYGVRVIGERLGGTSNGASVLLGVSAGGVRTMKCRMV